MNRRAIVITLILLVLLGIGAYFTFRNGEDTFTPGNGNTNGNSTTTPPSGNNTIRVTSPQPNATVGNSFTVKGEARAWYFEGSFPVDVIDSNGKRLGVGIAQAEGEWMTSAFVPFNAPITLTSVPTTQTGTIVLRKDNPSGLSQYDEEFKVPIRFSQVATSTRDIKLYFYNSQNDVDVSGNVLCSAKGLVEINRSIPLTNTPIQDAIRELLKGPTNIEKLNLMGTEFPLARVALTGASLSNGVLTLSFLDPENKTGGGSCRVNILRVQIEATAKQFPSVTTVRLAPDGLFQP
ncbi:MAG: Gmad2 immunoglobulin-like domain-containing protein [bacterium]|nr:Gmad2 immunoglobulin-like domain-containing protein [bacterium]